jgi:predicted dehydrogenase
MNIQKTHTSSKEAIPAIHVGCGPFGLQRLQILVENKLFLPIACVDIDVEKTKKNISLMRDNFSKQLANYVYGSITEAKEKHNAEVCFIYASSEYHPTLIQESLGLGMHTFCVKTISCNQNGFKDIIKVHKKNEDLMLVQGLNNQWNEAALMMKEWLNSDEGIGEMLGGDCICWGRQQLPSSHPETTIEGQFFLTLACHQLGQLVAAKGLPEFVTAYAHDRKESKLSYIGVWGTSGGQCLFEYPGGVPFSYTGTRAAHGNPFGFASRWSGRWIIHGTKGDIRREGGRVTLYKNGGPVKDYYLKDIDDNIIEDDKIQFNNFYEALVNGKNKNWLQESSLDTWILMEACNESARKNEKISIKNFKKNLME